MKRGRWVMSVFIGIDPGNSGAVAAIDEHGNVLRVCKFSDTTERDICDAITSYATWEGLEHEAFAVIEKVNAMPKQGVSSTFKFGQSYGFLRGVLIASEIRFIEVRPQEWQKAMGCLTKGDKNVSKAKAQQLFTKEKITHAVADAMLLADYCRRFAFMKLFDAPGCTRIDANTSG